MSGTDAQTSPDVAVIDRWCVKQMGKLSDEMHPFLLAGGDLRDPEYRHQLGQHAAFMRMRSYLHGAVRAHLSNQGVK